MARPPLPTLEPRERKRLDPRRTHFYLLATDRAARRNPHPSSTSWRLASSASPTGPSSSVSHHPGRVGDADGTYDHSHASQSPTPTPSTATRPAVAVIPVTAWHDHLTPTTRPWRNLTTGQELNLRPTTNRLRERDLTLSATVPVQTIRDIFNRLAQRHDHSLDRNDNTTTSQTAGIVKVVPTHSITTVAIGRETNDSDRVGIPPTPPTVPTPTPTATPGSWRATVLRQLARKPLRPGRPATRQAASRSNERVSSLEPSCAALVILRYQQIRSSPATSFLRFSDASASRAMDAGAVSVSASDAGALNADLDEDACHQPGSYAQLLPD